MNRSTLASRPLHDTVLSTLIVLLVAGGAIGGFLIGRNVTLDAFIEKVNKQDALDEITTLLSAGTLPLSLADVLGKRIDDPETTQPLARAYGVPVGDQQAFVQRARNIIFLPPYQPAPFVGHIARPVLGEDLRINFLGFRDERQTYLTKAERTVRIFISGGSSAWGAGISSQKYTISYNLERILNERVGPVTGHRYEVINAAFPAWSTTQERILIEQRLVDMHPDMVIMFSGNNDVHWSLYGRDIRWFYSYMDQNYITLLNEMYKSSGHPEWVTAPPMSSRPVECLDLARASAHNVALAAYAAQWGGARVVFALQPNIVSTTKRLTKNEQALWNGQNRSYWNACYEALRVELGRIKAPNYRLIDLSRAFGDLDASMELFIDPYHFADVGSQSIAQALADQIDWKSILPRSAVAAAGEPLTIVKLEATEVEESSGIFANGSSALRIIPSRLSKNLLVVFDRSILRTVVADNSITASISASPRTNKSQHLVYIVDSVTGETSPPVVFHSQ